MSSTQTRRRPTYAYSGGPSVTTSIWQIPIYTLSTSPAGFPSKTRSRASTDANDVVEEPGKWFAPHIGSLITSGGRLLLGMLEKCIADAGGTFLFCDTDSAAIVSTAHRQRIAMPNRAKPITALSRAEVQRIVDRFASLNPYDLDGSILKIHKLNWDSNRQRRQLYGYSIAAKRYALYTKSRDNIEIVEPKAHGLGYFYPPKDSPEGWERDAPAWIFEAWDWMVRGVFGLKRTKPAWFNLPVMMKLTLSTPTPRVAISRQRTTHAPEQFHDASANIALRTPQGC
jgi:hypothetical protein